jgi:hypothetical protein
MYKGHRLFVHHFFVGDLLNMSWNQQETNMIFLGESANGVYPQMASQA